MWGASAHAGIAGGTPSRSFAPGAIAGPGSTSTAWHPTVLTMLGLVAAEIFAIGLISRHILEG